MNQDIKQKAMQILDQRRLNAEMEYQEKMKPLLANDEFLQVEDEYSRTMIENAKLQAYGEPADLEKEKMLKEKLEKMKNGIKIEYFCKKCGDSGYVDGKMCTCLKSEISKLLLKESGFENLEKFADAKILNKTQGEIYKKLQQWCQIKSEKNLIYLAGPVGVGKTHLIRCMANELIERGKIIKITTAYGMSLDFREFSKTFNDEILRKYLDCEYLFIDDLGTEPIFKGSTVENLYMIINERKMRKKPTIITSNLTFDDLSEKYDERIVSRIADRKTSITIFIDGEDVRIKKC